MTTLAPGYDPTTFESRLYAQWEACGAFAPQGDGPAYCILLPPPNVTGTLHMGHAFQHTLQDALIRYHRMRGYRTLWQMGTDHAGIATEMVVGRNLQVEGNGETRDSLGREKFIEKVWEWKQQSGDTIERQMRRLGTSGDWTRSVFTMDPMAAEAVIESFVRLHEEGLIYRGQRLVNWDPVLKTAISDLEVVNEEEDGFLWSIAYPLTDGSGHLTVATTRPETMLGDSAVMVHPEDERYTHLIGKTVTLPLTGRLIPVIADDYVDREFGTGVVKVTPAHDFNDYQVWLRHKDSAFRDVPKGGLINIFTPDAKLKSSYWDDFTYVPVDGGQLGENEQIGANSAVSDLIPERYRGLDRYDARKAMLADLDALGLLVDTKPHKLQVPRGDRSGQVIEPYLTDQWFVKMDGLAKRGMELVGGVDGKPGQVKFVPPNWINTYRHWMENIQDWCISRQLWWGHRIPAWCDQWSNVFVGRDRDDAYRSQIARLRADDQTEEADLLETHALGSQLSDLGLAEALEAVDERLLMLALQQDADVLETWFSSSLWPINTMGWPNEALMAERGFNEFVPSSVLVTGFDIIFFWVARMIMATDHLTGRVPFRDVYITGLVRDAHGQKMSKSKGNVLDPLDIIDGIGIDALVAKRTGGLMQPKMAEKIEKATRKEFPDGIPAFGADALRFTIAALAGHGRDIKFDLGRAEGYKNFCNKLWNASRFVLMNTEGASFSGAPQARTDAERWILAQLAAVSAEAETHYASYRFDLLAQCLYEFAWNQFCDWFVELAKPALNGAAHGSASAAEGRTPEAADVADAAQSTRHTLLYVLDALLRLLHPLIPFVTEELWQAVAPKLGKSGSVMTQAYPRPDDIDATPFGQAAIDIEWLKSMVLALRRIRSELAVSPAKQAGLLVRGASANDAARLARFDSQLRFLCRLDRIESLAGDPPAAASARVGDIDLFVPLEGLVDLDAERVRLDKELARVGVEKDKSEAKLAKFGGSVPAAVVEQERLRLADWAAKLDALAAQRNRLA